MKRRKDSELKLQRQPEWKPCITPWSLVSPVEDRWVWTGRFTLSACTIGHVFDVPRQPRPQSRFKAVSIVRRDGVAHRANAIMPQDWLSEYLSRASVGCAVLARR
jgi:hypothetical protein